MFCNVTYNHVLWRLRCAPVRLCSCTASAFPLGCLIPVHSSSSPLTALVFPNTPCLLLSMVTWQQQQPPDDVYNRMNTLQFLKWNALPSWPWTALAVRATSAHCAEGRRFLHTVLYLFLPVLPSWCPPKVQYGTQPLGCCGPCAWLNTVTLWRLCPISWPGQCCWSGPIWTGSGSDLWEQTGSGQNRIRIHLSKMYLVVPKV